AGALRGACDDPLAGACRVAERRRCRGDRALRGLAFGGLSPSCPEKLDHLVEARLDPAEALLLGLTAPALDLGSVADAFLDAARQLVGARDLLRTLLLPVPHPRPPGSSGRSERPLGPPSACSG